MEYCQDLNEEDAKYYFGILNKKIHKSTPKQVLQFERYTHLKASKVAVLGKEPEKSIGNSTDISPLPDPGTISVITKKSEASKKYEATQPLVS